MGKITGRAHHLIKKPDRSEISSTSVISHMWNLGEYIHEYQIIQKAIDLFLIQIVPTKLYSENITKGIDNFMQKNFPYATVQIRKTDHIQREKSGKLLDFKNHVKE
jgi:hypothetical protein